MSNLLAERHRPSPSVLHHPRRRRRRPRQRQTLRPLQDGPPVHRLRPLLLPLRLRPLLSLCLHRLRPLAQSQHGAVAAHQAAVLWRERARRRDQAVGIATDVRGGEGGALQAWRTLADERTLGDADESESSAGRHGDGGEQVDDAKMAAEGAAQTCVVPVHATDHVAKAAAQTCTQKTRLYTLKRDFNVTLTWLKRD